MSALTYTVFDGDPATSGGCAWPSREQIGIEADDGDAVIAAVVDDVLTEAGRCGEYEPGDRLWITVWDEDGTIVASESAEVQS